MKATKYIPELKVYMTAEFSENPEDSEFSIHDASSGWLWDGEGNSTITFIYRVFNARYKEVSDFVYELKEKFDDDIIVKNIKFAIKNYDLYALTGDNHMWLFKTFIDSYIDSYEDELNDCELDYVYENFNYDNFMNYFIKTQLFKSIKRKIENISTYDEFLYLLENDEDFNYANIITEEIIPFIENLISEAKINCNKRKRIK